jgi:hypothetical protein
MSNQSVVKVKNAPSITVWGTFRIFSPCSVIVKTFYISCLVAVECQRVPYDVRARINISSFKHALQHVNENRHLYRVAYVVKSRRRLGYVQGDRHKSKVKAIAVSSAFKEFWLFEVVTARIFKHRKLQ